MLQNTTKTYASRERYLSPSQFFGGSFLAIASVIFLAKGLGTNASSFANHVTFSVMQFILLAGGLAIGRTTKKPLTLRILFVIGTALVAIAFASLGGLIFDFVRATEEQKNWAMSLGKLLLTVVFTGLLSLPLTRISFRFLTPSVDKKISLLYILNCLLFLVPMRDPWIAMVLIVGATSLTLFIEQGTLSQLSSEPLYSRLLLRLPIMIFVARSFFHLDHIYEVGLLLVATSILLHLPDALTQGALSFVAFCKWTCLTVGGLIVVGTAAHSQYHWFAENLWSICGFLGIGTLFFGYLGEHRSS